MGNRWQEGGGVKKVAVVLILRNAQRGSQRARAELPRQRRFPFPFLESMPQTPTEVDKRFQGYVGRLVTTTVGELKGEK